MITGGCGGRGEVRCVAGRDEGSVTDEVSVGVGEQYTPISNKKQPPEARRPRGIVFVETRLIAFLLCGCSRFELAHADCLGLAALCKSVYTLDGKSGVGTLTGDFMTSRHR